MGVASQSYLRAGVSVLLGIFVLGEQITQAIGLGLVAIILGVAVINISSPAFSLRRRSNAGSACHPELQQDGSGPVTDKFTKRST